MSYLGSCDMELLMGQPIYLSLILLLIYELIRTLKNDLNM